MNRSLKPLPSDARGLPERPEPQPAPAPPLAASVLGLQQSAGNAAVQRLLNGKGAPLESGVRSRMEGALGAPLDGVRVHSGPEAGQAADAIGARAFAYGRDMAFAPGEYRPGTVVGDTLIAHELAHVIQQRDAGEPGPADRASLAELAARGNDPAMETDAEQASLSLWSRAKGVARSAIPRLRSGLQLQSCGRTAPVAPPRVTAERVELGGSHLMLPGMGDDRVNPVWAPGATDHAAAFTKGAAPAVSARFALGPGFTMPDAGGGTAADAGADAGAAAPGITVRVKEGGAVRGEGPAVKSGSTVTVTNLAVGGLTGSTELGTRDYTLDWEASTDGGATWTPVISTGSHRVHWLYGTPLDAPPRARAVSTAVRYARGASDVAAISKRIRSGLRREDGLAYNPGDPINADPLTVLGDGVGICTDFGNLLTLLARTVGLNANAVMFWGGFESLGRNVWVTLGAGFQSLADVKSPDPAYNPPSPATGWAFTYHVISRIEGVLQDAALDREGIDGHGVHDGKVVHLAEGDPASPPTAVKGTAYSQPLKRKGHAAALTIRDYGPQILSATFNDVYAVHVPLGAPSPVDVPVLWTLMSGTLPPGLSLDPFSGKLSGTPTAPGSFPVEIGIFAGSADSAPMSSTYPITIDVTTP